MGEEKWYSHTNFTFYCMNIHGNVGTPYPKWNEFEINWNWVIHTCNLSGDHVPRHFPFYFAQEVKRCASFSDQRRIVPVSTIYTEKYIKEEVQRRKKKYIIFLIFFKLYKCIIFTQEFDIWHDIYSLMFYIIFIGIHVYF